MNEDCVKESLSMLDVPLEIRNSVYDKWSEAYLDGWDYDKLWNGCELCQWIALAGCGCNQCPLTYGSWCNNFGAGSRLSIDFRNLNRDEDAWRSEIRDFLMYLKPYCVR